MEKIDTKYLAGLKMTGGTTEIVVKDGRKTRKATPWERQATPEDVNSWNDYGTHVVVVIKNGKKYRVEKKGAKETKGEEKK